METWLKEHLEELTLTEDAQDYLLSRGVSEDVFQEIGFKTWRPSSEDAPDTQLFKDRYGSRGESLNGWLVTPIYCPRGELLGFEGRRFPEKQITRYLLGRSEWNPAWYGIKQAMPHLWAGKDPWIFEGSFDVEAMRLVLPDAPLLGSFRAKLTDKHVEFLRRILHRRSKVNVVFDNDETGQKGIKKASLALGRAGITCNHVPVTSMKDPNEVWERFGTEGLRKEFNL